MHNREKIQEIRAFNRFYTDLLGLLDTHLLKSDYSLAEARILYEIFTGGQVSASDIIHKLKVDKGYLSRILKKLEKQGLISKRLSKGDARVNLLSLTEEGLKIFHTLNNASDEQINTLITSLPLAQLNDLVKHMNAITDLLQKSKG
jgi:DNA-binding MarR family transcriptional regulator